MDGSEKDLKCSRCSRYGHHYLHYKHFSTAHTRDNTLGIKRGSQNKSSESNGCGDKAENKQAENKQATISFA